MGTRRMKLCTPGGTALSPWGATSQEPFAKLVWHPGPALEQAQNREGCWGYQKVANLEAALGISNIFCFSLSFLQQHPQDTVPAPLSPAKALPVTPISGSLQLFFCFKNMVYHGQVNQRNFQLFICCWNRGNVVTCTWGQVCNSLSDQAKTDLKMHLFAALSPCSVQSSGLLQHPFCRIRGLSCGVAHYQLPAGERRITEPCRFCICS